MEPHVRKFYQPAPITLEEYLDQVVRVHFAAETRACIAHATANAAVLRCSQASGFRPLREFMECGIPTLLLVREAS